MRGVGTTANMGTGAVLEFLFTPFQRKIIPNAAFGN
jgi:hypothetical protein